MIKLYGAINKKNKLFLGTVRKTEKESWEALKDQQSWSNCFDQTFTPSKAKLKEGGFDVVPVKLTWGGQ